MRFIRRFIVTLVILAAAFARWFGLLFPYLIGKDYDEGLARLKALAEKGAA